MQELQQQAAMPAALPAKLLKVPGSGPASVAIAAASTAAKSPTFRQRAHARLPVVTLVTGVTGFLGGASTVAMLETAQATDLLFLVRAKTLEDGVQRVVDSLARFELPETMLKQITTRQIILGDLAEVDRFADDIRLRSVTHVLNCAAVASFGDHPGIWPVNVTGTVAFAQLMARIAPLRRFVHIGTAMACGAGMTSPVQENWLADEDSKHLVLYTASKAEAERQMHAIPGFPLVVARPSIVVGHSALGCKPSTSIFWVFRMAHDLGKFLCDLDESVDVIPVDYCAKALLLLLFKEQIASDLYHISAGARSPSFREIEQAMADARGIPALGGDFGKITESDIKELVPLFKSKLGISNRRLVTKAMKLYGGFATLNYQFDNRRLLDEGLEQPPCFTTYIDQCIKSTEGRPLLEQMMDDFK